MSAIDSISSEESPKLFFFVEESGDFLPVEAKVGGPDFGQLMQAAQPGQRKGGIRS